MVSRVIVELLIQENPDIQKIEVVLLLECHKKVGQKFIIEIVQAVERVCCL